MTTTMDYLQKLADNVVLTNATGNPDLFTDAVRAMLAAVRKLNANQDLRAAFIAQWDPELPVDFDAPHYGNRWTADTLLAWRQYRAGWIARGDANPSPRYALTDADHLAKVSTRLVEAINEHTVATQVLEDNDDDAREAELTAAQSDACEALSEAMGSIRGAVYEYEKRAGRYRAQLEAAEKPDAPAPVAGRAGTAAPFTLPQLPWPAMPHGQFDYFSSGQLNAYGLECARQAVTAHTPDAIRFTALLGAIVNEMNGAKLTDAEERLRDAFMVAHDTDALTLDAVRERIDAALPVVDNKLETI